jgi:hypothetical protein
MDNHVWNKNIDSYLVEPGVFLYWGHSTKLAWPLEFTQLKKQSRLVGGISANGLDGFGIPGIR